MNIRWLENWDPPKNTPPVHSPPHLNRDLLAKPCQTFVLSFLLQCPHPEEPVATASAAEASSQEGDDVVQPGCSRWPENVAPSPKDMCAMCVSRPRDGILIHGQTSHSYGCYKCSRKLLTCNQRCPICRRHIDRVTRHYVD